MITKFDKTGSFNVRSGKGKKPISIQEIQKAELQMEDDKASNVHASTSTYCVAEAVVSPFQLSKTSCAVYF